MPPWMLPSTTNRLARAMAGLVVVLAVLLSGAPRVLVLLVTGTDQHCSVPCDGSNDDDTDCSPVCTAGPCAKISLATPGVSIVTLQALVMLDAAAVQAQPIADDVGAPPAGIASSVFHPPRV